MYWSAGSTASKPAGSRRRTSWAAQPMAGAVLRPVGSSRTLAAESWGRASRTAWPKAVLVTTSWRSGGISGARRSKVAHKRNKPAAHDQVEEQPRGVKTTKNQRPLLQGQPPHDQRGTERHRLYRLYLEGACKRDIVSSHATATEQGDIEEANALRRVFGDSPKTFINNTKSFIGHAMGAAGALELLGNVPSFDDGIVHATINLDDLDPRCALPNLVINQPREIGPVKCILNNSFGMLGINSVVIIRKFQG